VTEVTAFNAFLTRDAKDPCTLLDLHDKQPKRSKVRGQYSSSVGERDGQRREWGEFMEDSNSVLCASHSTQRIHLMD